MPAEPTPPPPAASPAPPSLARRVAVGTAWLVGARLASRTLGLVSTLVLARILVPADFGLIAMATAFAQSVDALSMAGLQDALIRHPEEGAELYDTAFTMQAIRGFLTAAAIALAAPFAGEWFADPRLATILLVLAALAALEGLENPAVAAFQRDFRYGREFAIRVAPRIAQVAVAIAAGLLLRTYWALILAMAVGRVLRVAATYAAHPHRPRITLRRWRDLFGFSAWTWATNIAAIAWARADAFIIAPALGASVFGLYVIAWEVGVLPVTELVQPAAAALFPGFAEARRHARPHALAPLSVMLLLVLLMAPLAVFISAAAGPAVAVLLGTRWLAAQPLVAIAALSCFLSPVAWVSGSLLLATGRTARQFAIVAASAAARVAMLVLAVRTRDIAVVTWFAGSSLAVECALYAAVLRSAGEIRLRDALAPLARIAAAALAAALAAWASGWGWRPSASAAALPALLGTARIAALVGIVFVAALALIWRIAGIPEGPERHVAALLRRLALHWRGARPA